MAALLCIDRDHFCGSIKPKVEVHNMRHLQRCTGMYNNIGDSKNQNMPAHYALPVSVVQPVQTNCFVTPYSYSSGPGLSESP